MLVCTMKPAISPKNSCFLTDVPWNNKTVIHFLDTNKAKVNSECYMNLLDDVSFLTADVSMQKMISFSNGMELQVTSPATQE